MITDHWFETEIADLQSQSRFRTPQMLTDLSPTKARLFGQEVTVFCSNDYLNLRWHPGFREALSDWTGPVGAGASRMVSGDVDPIRETETALQDWLGVQASLLLSSGYAANVGALTAIASSEDVIFSDSLNHASIVDGARLSRARVAVYPHRSVDALKELIQTQRPFRRGWIVTESLFSMDGDFAPLAELSALASQEQLGLYVDEAHSLGLFGPAGRGACAAAGVVPAVLIGTFGKSLGVSGAFVAGSSSLRSILWNKARSFVFSTGINVVHAVLLKQAISLIQLQDSQRQRLNNNCALLERHFRDLALPSPRESGSPIFPLLLGSEASAVECSAALRELGFFVSAIRPPTVPRGTSRLRMTVSAAHTEDEIAQFAAALKRVVSR